MSSLTELIQVQNDRITALEDATLDENLILPKIQKVYDGIKVSARIRVKHAKYYLCGQLVCGPTQTNCQAYEEVVY